jgi:hypothetical protein
MAGSNFRVDTRMMKRLRQQSPQRVAQVLRGAATEMVADIKLSFGTGPDGRTYRRGKVVHVASSPDNPPNSDTGTLMGSMTWTELRPGYVVIHDQTTYGVWLELGTERIAPRPFVGPVFEAWRMGQFERYLQTQRIIPW